MIRKNVSILPVILSATAIEGSDGEFLSCRETIIDNTDRKRIEEERLKAMAFLESSVKNRTIELDLTNNRLQIDLAKRHQAEVELQKTARRLLTVQRIGNIGFIEWKLNTGEMHCSEETYQVYGVNSHITPSLDLIIGLVHPDDLLSVQKNLDLAIQGKKDYDIDHRMIRQDNGKMIWVHAQAKLMHNIHGESKFLLGSVVDITKPKHVEEDLRTSEKGLADAQRITKLGSWRLDLVTKELLWSDETYRIFGLKPRELGVSYEFFLNKVHPEDRDFAYEVYSHSVMNKSSYDIVHRLFLKDKIIKYVNNKCETHYDPNGKPLYSIGTIQDITAHKLAEKELTHYREHLEDLVNERTSSLLAKNEELKRSKETLLSLLENVKRSKAELAKLNDRLKELDHLKSMFIASISHELRTPLNSILGFTGIILNGMVGKVSKTQKDPLERIHRSAKYLLELVTEIIDISKIDAGKIKFFSETFLLGSVVREAVTDMTPLAKDKGLQLTIDLPEEITLKTDKKRFLQCLLNYLSNAVKFTQKGKVTLSVKREGRWVEVLIQDTGIGIKKEYLSEIFQSFVMLDSSKSSNRHGTGLGLYITKKLVTEILGGSVAVESIYGQGSKFSLKIPIDCDQQRKA